MHQAACVFRSQIQSAASAFSISCLAKVDSEWRTQN